ncbi:hypothetical protein BGZ70_001386 [Mortierella alpina]|uniref:HAT C-terminal dimerisation domain-containing protein n=1 Tax=Mortierella alpina TaxID=64518 RepID=A0A9P6LXN7_MORAP|nr:hypothetical protein BGZ70_001386 [Mortierella alpina]
MYRLTACPAATNHGYACFQSNFSQQRNPFIVNDDEVQREYHPLLDDDGDVEQEYNPFHDDDDFDDSHDDGRDGNGLSGDGLIDNGLSGDDLIDNGNDDDFHGFHRKQYDRDASEDDASEDSGRQSLDMAVRVLRVVDAISASYDIMMDGTKDQKATGWDLGNLLLDDQECLALQEITNLMGPAAKLTHWARGKNITIYQIHYKVYTLIPPTDSNTSRAASLLHSKLEDYIKTSWPLKDIPDVFLIAMFFNPAWIASGPISKRPHDYIGYMDIPELYWKEKETSNLADLSRMARAYLSVHATSTASERLFSKAGLKLPSDRTKLLDTTFQNIIFYDSFLRLRNLLEKEDIN